MTMDDLVRNVNCKYCYWTTSHPESCTAWLECKLKKEATDEKHCSKCKDRVPKYNGRKEVIK